MLLDLFCPSKSNERQMPMKCPKNNNDEKIHQVVYKVSLVEKCHIVFSFKGRRMDVDSKTKTCFLEQYEKFTSLNLVSMFSLLYAEIFKRA